MFANYKLKVKPNTLRWKIIIFSFIIVSIIGASGFYLYYRESLFLNNYNLLIENVLLTQQLDTMVSSNSECLQKYKATESRNYIAQMNSNKEMMLNIINELSIYNKDTSLNAELNDLRNSTAHYSDVVNHIIFSVNEDRGAQISEAEDVLHMISAEVKIVYEKQTDKIRYEYRQFNDNKKNRERIASILFVLIVLCSLTSIILFINRILKPIKSLTAAAKIISKGNFEIPELNDNTPTEEINILNSTFRKMAENMQKNISELNQKVELEKKLKEEEVKNERNRVLLREAELMALQSQVNPHFMFNTLNIIAKIAYTEDADRTATMIGTMSKLLRYSLGRLNKVVTLDQEIANLEEYMFIQKTRFGERLGYIKKIECDISDIPIPCLTLQPIVENAIMHGIEGKEEGGYICVKCFREADEVVVSIKDNGVGMSREHLEGILNKSETTSHKGHTTGLGINNVKERLELFMNRRDVFNIESAENVGTEVIIRLNSPKGV